MPISVQKVSITHDAILDYVIANPSRTQREIAAEFKYTQVMIGVILRSDSFKKRLKERKSELVDPLIMQQVEDRLTGLAHMSMEVLERKLENSEDSKLALATLDLTTRAAGYGAKSNQVIQNQYVVHLPGPAANSQEWASKFAPRADLPVLRPSVEDAEVKSESL